MVGYASLQRSSHGKPVLQNSKKKRASFLKLYGQFSILVIMADEMCFKDFFQISPNRNNTPLILHWGATDIYHMGGEGGMEGGF